MIEQKLPQFAYEPKSIAGVIHSETNQRKGDFLNKWKVMDDARAQIGVLQKAGITNDGILFELTTPSKRMRENTHRETTIIGNRAPVIAQLMMENEPLIADIDSSTMRRALGFAIVNDIATKRMQQINSLITGDTKVYKKNDIDIEYLERYYQRLFETVKESDPALSRT